LLALRWRLERERRWMKGAGFTGGFEAVRRLLARGDACADAEKAAVVNGVLPRAYSELAALVYARAKHETVSRTMLLSWPMMAMSISHQHDRGMTLYCATAWASSYGKG
jgi:hypothetical protein